MNTFNLRIFEIEIALSIQNTISCEILLSRIENISQEHLALSPTHLGFCATDDLSLCACVGHQGMNWSCLVLAREH